MSVPQSGDIESDLLGVFRALANGERLAVLRVLRDAGPRGMNISQVGGAAELNRFTASRHLKVLCGAGLVSSVRHNQSVVHRLDPAGLERVEDWLYQAMPATDVQRFG